MKRRKAVRIIAEAAIGWLAVTPRGTDTVEVQTSRARNLLRALTYPNQARWVLDYSQHSYKGLYIPKYEKTLVRALEKLAEGA